MKNPGNSERLSKHEESWEIAKMNFEEAKREREYEKQENDMERQTEKKHSPFIIRKPETPQFTTILAAAKYRALKYLEQGDLKQAISSMVSDLSKDKDMTDERRDFLAEMGLALKQDPELDEKKVRDFIEGFNR